MKQGKKTFTDGTEIQEFSIDGTLIGNSDTAVPTEQAVKTYVDSQIRTDGEMWKIAIVSNLILNDDSFEGKPLIL